MSEPRLTTLKVSVDGEPVLSRIWEVFSADGFWLRLRFCVADADARRPLGAAGGQHVDSDRLRLAVEWLLDLDAGGRADFLARRIVTRDVPMLPPAPLPTLFPDAPADAYRSLRLSGGQLVRPLLLPTVDVAELFAYQRSGVAWLLKQQAGILADDMGLGKTLEAITAARELIAAGEIRQTLVVVPRSLMANWEQELARWAPELSRLRVSPTATHRDEVWRTVWGRVHIIVTNYEQLRHLPAVLREERADLVVADEAHRVRNLESGATRGARALQWRRFWALTGTPIERDTRDLATLLSTLDPLRFSPADSNLPPASLRARARPYILRRLKADVLDQLPAVLDSMEILDLLPRQRCSYEAALRGARTSNEQDSLLALINELRMICDYDPGTGDSAKVERIAEILANVAAAGEKAVVFSYLLRPLELLSSRLAIEGVHTVSLEGSMSLVERETALRHFRSDAEVVALLASSRVGGEGLTLTEANHVVFVNEWWNPSSNAQARDRVVRIGQRRGVRIHRFRCRATIEDALQDILETKNATVADIIDRLADGPSADTAVADLVVDIARRAEAAQAAQ